MNQGIDMFYHDFYHHSIDFRGCLSNIAESLDESTDFIFSILGQKFTDKDGVVGGEVVLAFTNLLLVGL